jgi:hypothetical protein
MILHKKKSITYDEIEPVIRPRKQIFFLKKKLISIE